MLNIQATVPGLQNPQNNLLGVNLIQALIQRRKDDIDRILADPSAEQISPADLGSALMLSFEHFRDAYYGTILNLPAAQQIPANGPGGIGHSLAVVCRIQEPDGLASLIQHPSFIGINANGHFSLSEALTEYLNTFIREREEITYLHPEPDDPNPEYLRAIINHPNANQINFSQPLSDLIGKALFYIAVQSENVFRNEDEEIVNLLLNVNIAHLISPNGEFGLGRIMANAAYSTTPPIVLSILAHPASFRIRSEVIGNFNKNDVERGWGLDQFGFESALFLAVNNGEPSVENMESYQTRIVQALINFTNTNQIVLGANTPFGLGESLTAAALSNDELTLSILDSHSSVHIQPQAPNQDSGGLDNALINAVDSGLLEAVRGILQHPNAAQIPIACLRERVQVATSLNQQIAEVIRNYALGTHRTNL